MEEAVKKQPVAHIDHPRGQPAAKRVTPLDYLLRLNAALSRWTRPALDELLAAETDRVLQSQLDVGIDVGSDGELPRIAFHMYVKDRMAGFGGQTARGTFSDIAKFPKWASLWLGTSAVDDADSDNLTQTADAPAAVGRASLRPGSSPQCATELDLFAGSLGAPASGAFEETFVTAASPGIVHHHDDA